jgi:hypothetical protein
VRSTTMVQDLALVRRQKKCFLGLHVNEWVFFMELHINELKKCESIISSLFYLTAHPTFI